MTTTPFGAASAPGLAPGHDEIARCAHELWSQAGRPAGRDEAIWLEAERRLLAVSPESDLTAVILHTLRQPTAGRSGRSIRES